MAYIKVSYTVGVCSKENNYASFSKILLNGQIGPGTSNNISLKNIKLQDPEDKFAVYSEVSDIYTRDTLFTHWEEGIKVDGGKIFYLGYQGKGLQEDDTIIFYAEPYKYSSSQSHPTITPTLPPQNIEQEEKYILKCRIQPAHRGDENEILIQ